MSLRSMLHWLRTIIVVGAIVSTTVLYNYPYSFGCAFPSTTGSVNDGQRNTKALHAGRMNESDPSVAPFRLLVLADPQLEGDSSLPDPDDALAARIGVHLARLRNATVSELGQTLVNVTKVLVLEDISRSLWTVRKTLDLFGNDYYLAHIYRSLHSWTKPTHVTVLGDLIGSQWVSDDEFEWRAWRYWNRVFSGARKVDEESMGMHALGKHEQEVVRLGNSTGDWNRKIINVAGNHDIGYAGDISAHRLDRFDDAFGKVNWDVKFRYPEDRVPDHYAKLGLDPPTIQLIVLNSMLLDTPALEEALQGDTFGYINKLISERLDPVESRNQTFTLLLTHVPLHKPEGVCADAPFFDFWDFEDEDGAFKEGGLKEQNHLSDHSSRAGVLQGIFGMSGEADAPIGGKGRRGLILTGHDHEGCDSVHYIERTTRTQQATQDDHNYASDDGGVAQPEPLPSVDWQWKSVRTENFRGNPPTSEQEGRLEVVTFLREITLRSMMGEYSGNAGLLSLWYDFEAGFWKYEMMMCPLGVQHIWWAVHVLDIIALASLLVWPFLDFGASRRPIASKVDGHSHAPDAARVKQDEKALARPALLEKPRIGQERSPSQRRRRG